ncbi:MAG: enoyl-CoA hydratase/isomerase family protein [Hyphomonadaceae bacterium]
MIRASKPCIAAINGVAIGVGLTLTLAFDVIIGSTNAKLGMGFIRMGLSPELASSRLIAARVGFGHASEMCLSGRLYSGQEAKEIGFFEHLTSPEELMPKARSIAASFVANADAQLRMAKGLLTKFALGDDLEQVLALEAQVLEACKKSPEHKEAVAAFLEKRPAKFR